MSAASADNQCPSLMTRPNSGKSVHYRQPVKFDMIRFLREDLTLPKPYSPLQ